MPVSLELRVKYLEDLRKKEPKTKIKVPYKGKVEYMGVYDIDLKYLIYNRHNGRLEIEMATWQTEEGVENAPYTDKIHKQIDDFLWETNPQRNKRTQVDLDEKGQLTPGIVTLDGVIIDGNRRAMLLGRLHKPFFEAAILPDRYDESEEWIVKLETQFQLGKDHELEYGPLQKYMKVKRLKDHLGVEYDEIAKLMGQSEGEIEKFHGIMRLMDEYLEHIQCSGLYKLLEDSDGTKEGMFVDLYQDLKRFQGATDAVGWVYDKDVDLLDLKTIEFDYIRYGDQFSGTEKDYRKIAHEGGGKKSFFAIEDLWKPFSREHRATVDPKTQQLGNLDDFMKRIPGHSTRTEAAVARDIEWKEAIGDPIKNNFYRRKEQLRDFADRIEPTRLLERALNALSNINVEEDLFLSNSHNLDLIKEINRISYEMKKRFDRASK